MHHLEVVGVQLGGASVTESRGSLAVDRVFWSSVCLQEVDEDVLGP